MWCGCSGNRMFESMSKSCASPNVVLILGIWILMLIPRPCVAQTQVFPNGVYVNHETLRAGVPDRADTLVVKPLRKRREKESNVPEYHIGSSKQFFTDQHIREYVLAYVWNDSVFLNGGKMGMKPAFIPALTKGTYLVFRTNQGTDANAVVTGG